MLLPGAMLLPFVLAPPVPAAPPLEAAPPAPPPPACAKATVALQDNRTAARIERLFRAVRMRFSAFV
jgi:hypothetical protein